MTDPDIILADEPTGNLDAASARDVLSLLQKLNKDFAKTVIMVTHDPHSAAAASRVIHLDKGKFMEAEAVHGRLDGTARKWNGSPVLDDALHEFPRLLQLSRSFQNPRPRSIVSHLIRGQFHRPGAGLPGILHDIGKRGCNVRGAQFLLLRVWRHPRGNPQHIRVW